jgi:hypothetical protein
MAARVTLLAIDPGTTESGWVLLTSNDGIVAAGKSPNDELLARAAQYGAMVGNELAIEMIASYGMPVGKEVFETCVWIGRFIEAWGGTYAMTRVTRNEVKNHLCGSSKAKDPNVRQRLIDLFGAPGTKKAPGPTYGITGDMWAALGVAATVRGLR